MPSDTATKQAIATLLCHLSDQLTKARNAAALAHDYLDLENPQAALGTLIGAEDEINQATALFKAILTLFRNQRPAIEKCFDVGPGD